MGLGFGAVTAKSITIQARPVIPSPASSGRSTDAGPGLVNCNGFQNPASSDFRLDRRRCPTGSADRERRRGDDRDYVKLVRELGPLGD